MNICVRFEKTEKASNSNIIECLDCHIYCTSHILYKHIILYLLFIILFNTDFNLDSAKVDNCLNKISIAIIIKITIRCV